MTESAVLRDTWVRANHLVRKKSTPRSKDEGGAVRLGLASQSGRKAAPRSQTTLKPMQTPKPVEAQNHNLRAQYCSQR